MELEGLRGLAAIVVACYHFLLAFYLVGFFGLGPDAPLQHTTLEGFIYANPLGGVLSGTFAVSIFFILSGFVLSIGFLQTGRSDIIKKLAAKRYLRLMLPALASVLICYSLMKLGLGHTEAASLTQSSWLATNWNFVPHLFDSIKQGTIGIFTAGITMQIPPYNNVLWTMTSEFIGSFMVFGSLLFFGQSRYRWLLYIGLGLVTFNTWLFGFIIGMVLADLFSKGVIVQKVRSLGPMLLLLIMGVYLGGYPVRGDVSHTAYGWLTTLPISGLHLQMVSTSLGATCVIFAVLATAQFASVLRHRWISPVGKYTFSLYLVHLPVLYTFTTGFFLVLQPVLGYNKAVLVAIVTSIPVVWLATVTFEKYIDSKAVSFAGYWADIYFGNRQLRLRQQLSSLWVYSKMQLASVRQRLVSSRLVPDEADSEIE